MGGCSFLPPYLEHALVGRGRGSLDFPVSISSFSFASPTPPMAHTQNIHAFSSALHPTGLENCPYLFLVSLSPSSCPHTTIPFPTRAFRILEELLLLYYHYLPTYLLYICIIFGSFCYYLLPFLLPLSVLLGGDEMDRNRWVGTVLLFPAPTYLRLLLGHFFILCLFSSPLTPSHYGISFLSPCPSPCIYMTFDGGGAFGRLPHWGGWSGLGLFSALPPSGELLESGKGLYTPACHTHTWETELSLSCLPPLPIPYTQALSIISVSPSSPSLPLSLLFPPSPPSKNLPLDDIYSLLWKHY